MKKLVSMLLALCMVLCMGVTAFSEDAEPGDEITNAVDGGSVSNDEMLTQAIESGQTDLTLSAGTYHMPAVAKGKTLTITGAPADTVIIEVVPAGQGEAGGQLDYNLDGSNVTFNNVTIKTNNQLYAGYARLSATYNNCVIQNTYNLGVGTSEFYNCTFNITNEYLRVGGATSAVFDTCTFNTEGRAILVFQDGTNVAQTVTVKNCTFDATKAAITWNGIHVAAVSIDGTNGTYTVNLEGTNIVDSDFNGLWQIKTGDANVTVNEEPTPDDGDGKPNDGSTGSAPSGDDEPDDSWYDVEEEEEDTHTSSSDMNELIEEVDEDDTSVTIPNVTEETTISKQAMEKAIEEGLAIEFKGDGFSLVLTSEEADFSEFKGRFNPYIDVDANCTAVMKSELKKNDIDPSAVQVIRTEYSGELPGEMTLSFTLDKELRGKKVYFYYWNPVTKQYEEIPCMVKGNKLVVKLRHFSDYIVTDEPIEGAVPYEEEAADVVIESETEDSSVAENPATGASGLVGAAVAMAVISSLGVLVVRKRG